MSTGQRLHHSVSRVAHAIQLLEFALIALFLWVAPLATLLAWLPSAAILLSVLGLLMDGVSLREVLSHVVRDGPARGAIAGGRLGT